MNINKDGVGHITKRMLPVKERAMHAYKLARSTCNCQSYNLSFLYNIISLHWHPYNLFSLSYFYTQQNKYVQGSKLTLARGEWKSRGMSRIFAQVVRRASGYLNLFCQLYVPTNESNYWNISRMTVNSITNHQNNLVDLITVCKLLLW